MDRAEGTAPGGDAASADRSGHQVGKRAWGLEEREHRADEREREADEREREANERERKADERERKADEREYVAQLRQRASELRTRAVSVREQAAQAVEEAETVLDACKDRVHRAEATLRRAYASAAREQATVARSVKRGEHYPAPEQRDFADLADRVSALRKRTAEAAARLAKTEEHAARIHDELAAREPGNPEHKRLANEAREAMRLARETERKYSGS